MANLEPVHTGGVWNDDDVPGGAAATVWDQSIPKCINGAEGSTHAPTSPIILGGTQGVELHGAPLKVLEGGNVTIDGGAVAIIGGGSLAVVGGPVAITGGTVTIAGGDVHVAGGNVNLTDGSKLRVAGAASIELTAAPDRIVTQAIRPLSPPPTPGGGYFYYAADGALAVTVYPPAVPFSFPGVAAQLCPIERPHHGAMLTKASVRVTSAWTPGAGSGGLPFSFWDFPGVAVVARAIGAGTTPASLITLGTITNADAQAAASGENGSGRLFALDCACAPVAGVNPIDTTAYEYFVTLATGSSLGSTRFYRFAFTYAAAPSLAFT